MRVKLFGDSDTEASLHESGDEVSDVETSSTHPVTPPSASLSLSLNTTSELSHITDTTPSISSPATPVITTTVASSSTWSTGLVSSAESGTSLPPWQTTTGIEFGRPSSVLYVPSTTTPTSAMIETLTKFMKDEFSKLHARIDRATSQRPTVTPTSSGISRFDTQWMERIDERLEDLQIVVQTNTEQVAELKTQLESLKVPPTAPELNTTMHLTAQLQQLSEQVQKSQQMISEIKQPSPEEFLHKFQAVTAKTPSITTEISCQTLPTQSAIPVEYDIGITPNNKSMISLLAQQSSACGPNPGLKIREGAYQRPSPENARFPPSSLLARRMARQELTEKEVTTLRASGAISKDIKTKIQMVTFANSLPYSQTTPAPRYEVSLPPKEAYKQFLSGLNSTLPSNSTAAATDTSQQVVIHNGIHFMDFATFCKAIEKICVTVKPRICHTELRESWTQTVTTQAQSLYITNACQNCRQRDHKIAECRLPWRPDMCHVCYQDQVTTATCFRPHDKQYKDYLRGRCQGCGIPVQLFDPHCNSCNRRYPGYKDWIAAKYSREEIEQFHRSHLRAVKKTD
ncbi:uncharacterized protein LOC130670359 [Microplitis mediator]|uniref:uncharacterized protein LOC130670359 n=1 Tax=Microplitis mediator TaxID=375433 RepID=UPI002557BF39|nr:uncharacterized protein LOC130670359 [Microplitis mediator]